MLQPLAFQMPGFMEMCLIAGVGLLIFGKRLPEVGKSLGKGIVEFKKGLKGIEDEVDAQVSQPAMAGPAQPRQAQIAPPAYRFDPYTGQPIGQEQPVPNQPVPQATQPHA